LAPCSTTVFLKPAVDPGLGQGGVDGGGPVEQVDADRVVADAGGGDDDREQQAEGVGDDAAFAADDLHGVGAWVAVDTLVEVLTLWVSMMDAVGGGGSSAVVADKAGELVVQFGDWP
jgi:hypothetical protein